MTDAERIARRFHELYEEQAPAHGWSTQQRSRVAWDDVPKENRSLMVAVTHRLLAEGVIDVGRALALDEE